MNMKWFKKYALPAVLAAVVPVSAQAQVTYTFDDMTRTINAAGTAMGAKLFADGTVNTWADGDTAYNLMTGTAFTRTATTGAAVYNLGAFDVTLNGGARSTSVAVYSDDLDGTFNLLKDINVKTTATRNATLDGLLIENGATNEFVGSINGGKNITVTNTATVGNMVPLDPDLPSQIESAEAYGIRFTGDENGKLGAKAVVDLGTVTVKGGGFSAAMVVGDIATGAKVHIAAADVTSTNGAVGVHVNGAANVGTGTLAVDSMKVTSTNGGARGLVFSAGGGPLEPLYDNTAKVTLGDVTVAGKTDVVAIHGAALKDITLNGDITATSKEGDAYGISANSAEFTAVGNVAISGTTEGINTTGNLTTKLADGANLVVNVMDVGGDLAVAGKGTADLGTTRVDGGTSITGGAAATFATGSTFDGSKTVDADSSVTFVGETFSADDETAFLTWQGVDGTVQAKTDMGNFVLDSNGQAVRNGTSMSTGFVSAATVHQRYSTWNTVRNHMISAADLGGGSYRGQECDPCDPIGACDPCGGFGNQQLQRTAWVNYIGRAEEYNDANGNGKWNLGLDGVQAGTDLYKTRRNQLGVNMGYEGGDLINGLNKVDSENVYLGLYGAHIFRNGWDTRASFTYGWQSFDMVRASMLGNLFDSSFDGNTTESTIEFGKRFAQGAWSLRPVFGVDVMTTDLDSATEKARTIGATTVFSKADMTQVFLRTGAELRWQKRRLGFDTSIFYSYDVNGDTLDTTATTAGNTQVLSGSELGREMLMFNVGGSYALGRNFTVFGGYQGQAVLDTDSDAYQNVGYVGGAWKW